MITRFAHLQQDLYVWDLYMHLSWIYKWQNKSVARNFKKYDLMKEVLEVVRVVREDINREVQIIVHFFDIYHLNLYY